MAAQRTKTRSANLHDDYLEITMSRLLKWTLVPMLGMLFSATIPAQMRVQKLVISADAVKEGEITPSPGSS